MLIPLFEVLNMGKKSYFNSSLTKILIFISFATFSFSIYMILFKNNIIPTGSDISFHLNRIEELRYSLVHKQLLPSNGLHSFSHIGLAVNTFYPYLFLYPIALLQLLFSPIRSYYIGLAIYTFISFLISYNFAKKILNSSHAAYIFSLVYNTSSYLLFQITLRADIGEYLALIFLPISFYGLSKLDDTDASWLMLPLGMALIAYSHILSLIIFAIAFLIYLCFSYKDLTFSILKRIVYSVIIFSIIALPFFLNLILIKIQDKTMMPPVSGPLKEKALAPASLLNSSISNTVAFGVENINLGITLIISFFILIFYFKTLKLSAKKFFLTGLILLLLTTKIFPWFLLQRTPLAFIQFPYRFLGPAAFFIALSISKLSLQTNSLKRRHYVIMVMLLLLTVLSYTNYYAYMTKVNITDDNYFKIARNARYKDYMPDKSIPYANDILNHISIVNGKKQQLNTNKYSYSPKQLKITVHHLKPNQQNTVDLPILRYSYDQKYLRSKRSTILMKIKPKHITKTITYTQQTPYPSAVTALLSFAVTIFSISFYFIKKHQ